MASASARHILVATEKKCEDLKKKIDKGVDFLQFDHHVTLNLVNAY